MSPNSISSVAGPGGPEDLASTDGYLGKFRGWGVLWSPWIGSRLPVDGRSGASGGAGDGLWALWRRAGAAGGAFWAVYDKDSDGRVSQAEYLKVHAKLEEEVKEHDTH